MRGATAASAFVIRASWEHPDGIYHNKIIACMSILLATDDVATTELTAIASALDCLRYLSTTAIDPSSCPDLIVDEIDQPRIFGRVAEHFLL